MNEQILNLALASLPAELLQDKFFENLCNTIPIEFKLLKKIEIEASLYLIYKHIDPNITEYLAPIKGKNNLLNLKFIYPTHLLTINISKNEENYLIQYIINNGQEKTTITCKIAKEHTQVKIVTITRKDGIITSYIAQAYDYDKDYKKVNNPNSIIEILKDFSNLFYITFELSYYYYVNFKKHYQDLHRNRMLNEIKLDEETRPRKEIYTFIEPMSLTNFKESINKYAGVYNTSEQIRINRIFNELESKIKGEEIVITKSLFESIIKYIMGYTADIIFSHGIILTKEEDYYGFYHVLITNDKIDITKELIAAEFAKKLFSISESNEESESLKDFFGITPTK